MSSDTEDEDLTVAPVRVQQKTVPTESDTEDEDLSLPARSTVTPQRTASRTRRIDLDDVTVDDLFSFSPLPHPVVKAAVTNRPSQLVHGHERKRSASFISDESSEEDAQSLSPAGLDTADAINDIDHADAREKPDFPGSAPINPKVDVLLGREVSSVHRSDCCR